MRIIGLGVIEIRVHRGGEYRVLCAAKFREAVNVLRCFHKRTGQADIDKARRCYDQVVAARRAEEI